jgi:gamma-glutamylcysteine synthetase
MNLVTAMRLRSKEEERELLMEAELRKSFNEKLNDIIHTMEDLMRDDLFIDVITSTQEANLDSFLEFATGLARQVKPEQIVAFDVTQSFEYQDALESDEQAWEERQAVRV